MNVHMLKHLPECVLHWGPLWVYSCFKFESANGHLKVHYHGTKAMNTQVMCITLFGTILFNLTVLQLAFSFLMMQVLPPVMKKKTRRYTACVHSLG